MNTPKHLSKTHHEQQADDELTALVEMTGLSAAEINASMSAPDEGLEPENTDGGQ